MAFRPNNDRPHLPNDRFTRLTSREQRIVEKSWAKTFADIVFPAIREARFAVLYSDNQASRPATPVNIVVGALTIKEFTGLSDEELFASICCDVRFQYALHTTSMIEQPVSDRTFSRFRERLARHKLSTGQDLLKEEIEYLTSIFAKHMHIDGTFKRMDSLMVDSSCKHMTRIDILYTTVYNAVRLLHRLGADDQLPTELLHYLDDDDHNRVIYHCKDDDLLTRIDRIIQDALLVLGLMDDDLWKEFQEYQILIRMLSEQTVTGPDEKVTLRPSSEISPQSLQNPSDPDATYREKAGKKHKGFVANLIESVGDSSGLVTAYAFEPNSYSDSQFCKDYLNSREEDAPAETVVADGAFGGEENMKLAAEKNVRLITTALSGKDPDPVFADFSFSEDGTVVDSCAAGYTPLKSTYNEKNEQFRVLFPKEACSHCANREKCKAKEQKNSFVVTLSHKKVNRARYRKLLSTEEYRELTRRRNAIEGIPSVLRRKYHVDHMPVRGKIRSEIFFSFKIGAYNFTKLYKHERQRAKYAQMAGNS